MPMPDEVAINAVRQEFLKAYNDGNAASLAACCSDDVVQLPPHEPAVRGQQAIRARYEAQFDRFDCQLSTTTEELQVLDQWAFAWGNYEIALKPRGDGATIRDDGKYMAMVGWNLSIWPTTWMSSRSALIAATPKVAASCFIGSCNRPSQPRRPPMPQWWRRQHGLHEDHNG